MKYINKGKHKGKYKCHQFVVSGHRGWKKILFRLFGRTILRSHKLYGIFGKENVYLDLRSALLNDYGIESEYCEKCKHWTYYGEDYFDNYKISEPWLYCGYCGKKIDNNTIEL